MVDDEHEEMYYGGESDVGATRGSVLRFGAVVVKPVRSTKGMLGFKWDGQYFVGTPSFGAFRPKGLMVWDPPKNGWMKQTLVANNGQILASWDPVPVEFFATARSFEQIAQILEKDIEPPTWCEFDTCHVANTIRVQITDELHNPVGYPTRVAMWGLLEVRS